MEGAVAIPYLFPGVDGKVKKGYVFAVKKGSQEMEMSEGMKPWAPSRNEVMSESVESIVDAETKLFKIGMENRKSGAKMRSGKEVDMWEKWVCEAKERAMLGREAARMREEADKQMRKYVEDAREKRSVSDKLASGADEDGWTVVGKRRGGSNKKSTDGKGTSVKIAKTEVAKKRLGEMVEGDKVNREEILREFYNFRAKETRKRELAKLQKRFQADREKVQKMKADRKFKL